VRQVVVHLLAVIQQQAVRIAALEARVSQNSSNSDRPPSSDSPFVKPPSSSTAKGTPGAKPGHPGHRQALYAPTQVIEVKPESYPCGQTEFPGTTPYYTHQVVELPEIQIVVKHMVLQRRIVPDVAAS
jgi:transposase